MIFFDSHAHLPDTDPDGAFAPFYARAVEAGVPGLLLCASGMADAQRCADAAATDPHVFFAAGVHPQEAASDTATADGFRTFFDGPRLAAIGEIGLDYYYDGATVERQREVFADFLSLALERHLPAVVHCRDKDGSERAYEHAWEHLKPYSDAGGEFVLHAFAGTPEWAERFLIPGARFGVGGMLTFKRADNIRASVQKIPLERILLETDTPYLAPVPFRGKPNHPALLPYTARFLADQRGMSIETLSEVILDNTLRFLHIPKETFS